MEGLLASKPAALAAIIVMFGFVIFVHELGHFLVAKWVGIRCTQFAVGFGHALLAWRRGIGVRLGTTEPEYFRRIRQYLREHDPKPPIDDDTPLSDVSIARATAALGLGETEYRLNWMPLGGYVKMLGQEDLDPNALSDDPRAYNNKPVWARMCVISAGVIMNAVFAVVFFVIAFLHGVEFPPAIIGDVMQGAPAATTPALEDSSAIGLQPGDRIVLIDGETPGDFNSLKVAAALGSKQSPLELVVERPADDGGEPRRLTYRIQPQLQSGQTLLSIGVAAPQTLQLADKALVGKDESLAAEFTRHGLEPGMKLVRVDGKDVSEYWQVRRIIAASRGKPLPLAFADEAGKTIEITAKPQVQFDRAEDPRDKERQIRHLLGLVPATQVVDVIKGQPADGMLKPGDIIKSVNGHDWPPAENLSTAVRNRTGDTVKMTVIRDGQAVDLEKKPNRGGTLGFIPGPANDNTYIADVLPDSPFSPLQLPRGTKLLTINGQSVGSFSDMARVLLDAGEMVRVTVKEPLAGGLERDYAITLTGPSLQAIREMAWLPPDLPPFKSLFELQQASSVSEAVVIGVKKTHVFMLDTYATLRALLTGTVPAKELRGPVGIADIGTQIAPRGWAYLLFFFGLISINLAVINFLPLPIVDGGHFVLLIVEKLRGRPVSAAFQTAITLAGLALLLSLFLFVTYHDIARLVTGTQ